ncbi:MAG TPA: GNAT family N-acetyltransferase [Symbiobacteriaceae bacterium]|nr:GNAT family N-acetyltransferase [Symbiobacteriaceae bacterium]
MELRRATEADIEALAQLYLEFHNFHAEGVPSHLCLMPQYDEETLQGLRGILSDPMAALIVCVEADTLLGMAEVYVRETEPNRAVVQRRYGFIQSLMVTGSRRRHGLGAILLDAAHRWVKEQGADEVELETWEFPAGPLGFYESAGYTTLKRRLVRRI